ncbi:MAG: hypothetical protein ACJ73N_00575 [Bryobacteraceae bacterium]
MTEFPRQFTDTHIRCGKCGVLYPQSFLACPACLGFSKKREQWVRPGKRKPKQQPAQGQTRFDESDYPA